MKKFGIIEMLGDAQNVTTGYWTKIYVSIRKITCM